MMLTLRTKTPLGGNAWAFEFIPERPLHWEAGQFIKVDLPHAAPDAEGTARRFTIAAAPHQANLTIATRLTNTTFKRALAGLPPGGQITLVDTPAGDFVWRTSPKPHVFVAQGIGITPYIAILRDRRHHGRPADAHLVYANHPGQPILFRDELESWAETDPSLQITFLDHPATASDLATDIPDIRNRTIYVSGPKPLIALLMPPYNLPASQLKQDNFPGYAAAHY